MVRRASLILLAASLAAPALAQPAPAADAPKPLPICTTTTTVVKQGEVILSTKTSTHCEDEGGGGGSGPLGVIGALGEIRPGAALGSIFGGEKKLEPREVRGDWKLVERGNRRVCRVTFMSEPTRIGRKVRTVDCVGQMGQAGGWTIEEDRLQVLAKDGKPLATMTANVNGLSGAFATGDPIALIR